MASRSNFGPEDSSFGEQRAHGQQHEGKKLGGRVGGRHQEGCRRGGVGAHGGGKRRHESEITRGPWNI